MKHVRSCMVCEQAEVEALHGLLNKSNKRKAEQITARVSKLELA